MPSDRISGTGDVRPIIRPTRPAPQPPAPSGPKMAGDRFIRSGAARPTDQRSAATAPLTTASATQALDIVAADPASQGADMSAAAAPAPSVKQALDAMNSVFYGAVDQSNSGGNFTKIVRDANDSNDQSEDYGASAQVSANRSLEQASLQGLSPTQQADYQQVVDAMQNDPIGRLSMQKLLFDGTFTSATKNKDNQDLLGALAKDAQNPTANGIDKSTLLAQLVHEIAVPDCIDQQADGTCTVTCAAIRTSLKDPAEYARVVGQLASPSGQATLANGDQIQRAKDWNSNNDGGRSLPQQLWEPALMAYGLQADGKNVSYDNATDKASNDKKAHDGLDQKAVNRVDAGVSGEPVKDEQKGTGAFLGLFGGKSKQDVVNDIAQQADAGNPVSVAVQWGDKKDSGHQLLVTGVQDGQVEFDNPWGAQQTMSENEFTSRLDDAHLFNV